MSTREQSHEVQEEVTEAALDAAGSSNSPSAAETEAAQAESTAATIKKLEDEKLALRDAWLRTRADIENLRKQAANDVSKAYKYAIEKFAEEMLPVKDSLESALAADKASPDALRAGVELTLKQLTAAFEKSQLKEIAPLGERFDPHAHQAMAMVASDQAPNTVVNVMQKGYRLNDRVLRPALVAVAKAPEASA